MKNKFPKVLIELKPSRKINGEIGVFTVRSLKKGVVIGNVDFMRIGKTLKWDEYNKFDDQTRKKIDDFSLGNNFGFQLPEDFNYLSVPWYLNHSCEGNIGFDKEGNFITIRKIKEGEELTYDYGLAEANPNFKMKCKCGSKKCRKIITGNDWKKLKLDKEMNKYILRDLIK